MDIELTEEQTLLRSTTARYCADRCSVGVIRSLFDDAVGVPPGYVEEGAALGWFSLLVPESLGGGSVSGAPIVDALIVAEARGAALQPGPFAGMNAVAHTLAVSGSAVQQLERLPSIIGGEVAAWVNGDGSRLGVAATPLRAREHGGGWRVDGTVNVVQEALTARWLLITALGDGGEPVQFLVSAGHPGVSVERVQALDLTRRVARVRCEGMLCDAAHVVGAGAAALGDTRMQTDLASVLTAADSLGALGRLFEMTVAYSKERIAFGRAIGGFQAIKHLLSDLSLTIEMARALTAGAAEALQRAEANASLLASAAASFVGDAAVEVAQGCFQVHGGIGHTWEHDLHLYLRRVSANAALFGTPAAHRERIIRLGEQPC